MPRIAVFGDVHANLVALDAVLADIHRSGADQIVCLGDVAGTGPQPVETLERVRDLGCRVVRGNVDAAVSTPERLTADDLPPEVADLDRWCAERLPGRLLAFLADFEPSVRLEVAGVRLLLVHGSPRSFDEAMRPTTPAEELDAMLRSTSADVVVCAHTHEPMVRRHAEATLVNPGSVGLPYEGMRDGSVRNPPWAEYGLLTIDSGRLEVSLRRVPIDPEAVVAAMRASGMPHVEAWAQGWLRPPATADSHRRDGCGSSPSVRPRSTG